MYKKYVGIILVSLLLVGSFVGLIAIPKAEASSYNYGEALQKAIYFYMQQRSGDLPDDNPVIWRADACLNDGSDVGLDLTGGYFDAGDLVKFGLPMASTAATLGWAVYEYGSALQSAGQLDEVLGAIKWATDYFIKCHTAPNEFYYQVGHPDIDHNWWVSAEVTEEVTPRSSYKVTTSSPGTTVCGATATAFAIASIIFQDTDPTYASTCLTHAEQLFDFANSTRSDNGYTAAAGSYDSYSLWDELSGAAIWLYLKTGNTAYLDTAEECADNWPKEKGYFPYKWTHCWDDMNYMAQILMARETGKQIYIDSIERNLDYWLPGGGITYTPGGLAWLDKWGCLAYASGASLLAFVWADDPLCNPAKKSTYRNFAESQIKYILGDNPRGGSYVIGFGVNSPQNPHHTTAHGSWANSLNVPELTRHTLFGGLVGGPDRRDKWKDDRGDYIKNEVACDYNMALVGALAKLYSLYGGELLPDFPQNYFKKDQDPYAEYFSNAKISSEGAIYTEISNDLTNHAAWPATVKDKLSYRYYFDLTEAFAAGYTVNDVTVSLISSEVPVTVSGPTLSHGNVYYATVDYAGTKIYPAGLEVCAKESSVRISLPSGAPDSAWDPTNDWSHQGLTGTYAETKYIPVYDAGVLLYGAEPDATPPAPPTGLTATAVSSSKIDLDWDDNTEPDLEKYRVYQSTTSGFTPGPDTFMAETTVSSYSDTGLNASTTYYYRVTAVDMSGNESEPSAEASATTPEAPIIVWDFQCHSHTHPHFSHLTDDEIRWELEQVNLAFQAHGYPTPEHHAYPYGDYGKNAAAQARIKGIVAEYRLSGRTVWGISETYPVPDWYEMKSAQLKRATSWSKIQGWIDDCIANNELLHIFTHDVKANPSSGGCTPEKLAQMLDYLVEKQNAGQLTVMTMKEAYTSYSGSPTVVVSFDDAWETDYTTVYPMFKARGLAGTSYIVTSFIGEPDQLTWEMIDEMRTGA